MFHPHPDEHGQPVRIAHPSEPTPRAHWSDPQAVVTVVPGGWVPPELNGIPFVSWRDAPIDELGWQAACAGRLADVALPPVDVPPYFRVAAGAVIEESDGRIWLMAPTNRFGGYVSTPPKGRVGPGGDLQVCAVREVFEETGLAIRITGHLVDAPRTTSFARWFTAVRIGGSPADMGWEAQAVHLVPPARWQEYLPHPADAPVLAALRARRGGSG